MNTTTAYLASNYLDGTSILLSKGKAKDWSKSPSEVELHYNGNLDDILKTTDVAWHIVSSFIDPEISRHYYFSREEAIAAAKAAGADAGVWCCYDCHIDTERFGPVKLPIRVNLLRSEKGLFCRLNLHPEENGYRAQGKVFFPDRRCADNLCEGPVIVKSVIDKGNYGFFVGEMVQYRAPSDEQVSQYIIENSLYGSKVRFMEGKFGTHVNIPDLSDTSFSYLNCLVLGPNGNVEKNCDMTDYGEAASKCTEEILGMDLVCQGYQGCNFADLYGQFARFSFKPHQSSWSTKFISKLFDDAIKCRFISLNTTNNVDFVEVDKEQLMYSLDQFSREEMAEIIAKVNEINTKANEAVAAKVRSGKLHLC